MKIHTNAANELSLVHSALRDAKAAGLISPDVHFDKVIQRGSRSRAAAVDVHLVSYSGGPGTAHPRRPNSGSFGADNVSDVYAATYDEWGHFLARVFLADPYATTTPYPSADAFHARTADRYRVLQDAN